MRALFVVGTRPEAIKLAPVVRHVRGNGGSAVVCTTGQHRELVEDALAVFGIEPDLRLATMTHDQDLSALTARLLVALAHVFTTARPDVVIVQGDTATAFAGALAAFYARIPVAHVEAGLRTHRADAPFPEEVNRRMIAATATWHFAPPRWRGTTYSARASNPRASSLLGTPPWMRRW